MINSENDFDFLKKYTKEELIFLIRFQNEHCLCRYQPKELELFVNDYRARKLLKEESEEYEKSLNLLDEANYLLKPYKTFSEIPEKIIIRYAEILEEAEKADNKAKKLWRRYCSLSSKLD